MRRICRSRRIWMLHLITAGCLALAGIPPLPALATLVAAMPASADTKDKKIALSNNYAGNSWRQAMLNSYDIVTKKAVADKVGAPFPIAVAPRHSAGEE